MWMKACLQKKSQTASLSRRNRPSSCQSVAKTKCMIMKMMNASNFLPLRRIQRLCKIKRPREIACLLLLCNKICASKDFQNGGLSLVPIVLCRESPETSATTSTSSSKTLSWLCRQWMMSPCLLMKIKIILLVLILKPLSLLKGAFRGQVQERTSKKPTRTIKAELSLILVSHLEASYLTEETPSRIKKPFFRALCSRKPRKLRCMKTCLCSKSSISGTLRPSATLPMPKWETQ